MTIVLVTGATGLIGSNICAAALEQGYEVRALVRDQARADERLGHHPTPLRPAMERTVAWMLDNGFV
jgi:uncharacterized protein YbjT (DUF2867 family)